MERSILLPCPVKIHRGIIYNKAYFDENGWTEPATYDEFIELCQQIKDKGDMAPLVSGRTGYLAYGFLVP